MTVDNVGGSPLYRDCGTGSIGASDHLRRSFVKKKLVGLDAPARGVESDDESVDLSQVYKEHRFSLGARQISGLWVYCELFEDEAEI